MDVVDPLCANAVLHFHIDFSVCGYRALGLAPFGAVAVAGSLDRLVSVWHLVSNSLFGNIRGDNSVHSDTRSGYSLRAAADSAALAPIQVP